MHGQRELQPTTLWIGATSGLARTFLNRYCGDDQPSSSSFSCRRADDGAKQSRPTRNAVRPIHDFVLVGLEAEAPLWLPPGAIYEPCDLRQLASSSLPTTKQNPKKKSSSSLSSSELSTLHRIFRTYPSLQVLIISVKSDLVWNNAELVGGGNDMRLLYGIKKLVQVSVQTYGIRGIIHISSVAVANHLVEQVMVKEEEEEDGDDEEKEDLYSVEEQDLQRWRINDELDQGESSHRGKQRLPPLKEYKGPYDIFKRQCEHVITDIVTSANNNNSKASHPAVVVHLRLSAIFSDSPDCIQCSALQLQSYVGSYLPTRIDCNSSWNVALVIRLFQHRLYRYLQEGQQQPSFIATTTTTKPTTPFAHQVYYYTRCTIDPIPYGEYLLDYLRAYEHHNLSPLIGLWIPWQWTVAFVAWFHAVVQYLQHTLRPKWFQWFLFHWILPSSLLLSVDYLLQVSAREHTFDNSRFRREFFSTTNEEESILECFQRRRAYLLEVAQQQKNKRRNVKGTKRKVE